tara:strand:+ start:91 stop:540 length:450 start_codon:yes stop_codon:yes gene_type:complete
MAASDLVSSSRTINVFSPQSVGSGGAIVSTALDTKGWRWAVITVSVGTNLAVTSAGTLPVQFSATSGGTYATPTGATFVLPDTTDDFRLVGVIDLQQMNRWMKMTGTGAAGTGACLYGITVTLYGCDDTTQYINSGAGEADVLEFTILT